MGLTIHYSLRMEDAKVEDVLGRMEKLRQACLDMPFEHVGKLQRLKRDAANFNKSKDKDNSWLLCQAMRHSMAGESIFPAELVCFSTWPGSGCEAANVGLGRYPGMKGWRWNSFCKTQYADDFGRCHLLVVSMLDKARELGILDEVSDEGEYWETRDRKILGKSLSEYNELVAAVVGMHMVDGNVEAPILKNKEFKHLERRGKRRLRKK